VPSFYLIMDDLSKLIAWAFKGIVGAKEMEAETPDPLELQSRSQALETSAAAAEAKGRKGRPELAAE
jgi:hypothetical protein